MSVENNRIVKTKEIADKDPENNEVMDEAFPTSVNNQVTDEAVKEESFPTAVNDQITD